MSKEVDFTPDEKQFLLRLLSQMQVNPLGDGAEETVRLVRSIARKLATNTEEEPHG